MWNTWIQVKTASACLTIPTVSVLILKTRSWQQMNQWMPQLQNIIPLASSTGWAEAQQSYPYKTVACSHHKTKGSPYSSHSLSHHASYIMVTVSHLCLLLAKLQRWPELQFLLIFENVFKALVMVLNTWVVILILVLRPWVLVLVFKKQVLITCLIMTELTSLGCWTLLTVCVLHQQHQHLAPRPLSLPPPPPPLLLPLLLHHLHLHLLLPQQLWLPAMNWQAIAFIKSVWKANKNGTNSKQHALWTTC